MVRELLREALANRAAPPANPQTIRIASVEDLRAFLTRILAPGVIEAVQAGTMKFTLAATVPLPGPDAIPVPAAAASAMPLLDGVVSERKLAGFAPGSAIRLTSTAVLTPMAKDVARRLGLTFERIG